MKISGRHCYADIFCQMGQCWCQRKPNQYPACPPRYMRKLEGQLTKGQIQHLYNRFCLFAGDISPGEQPPVYLYKWNFYNGLVHLNPLLPSTLDCMFDGQNAIDFLRFATFLIVFQANSLKTTDEEKNQKSEIKKRILFTMYDRNKDGYISRSDLVFVVHKLFSAYLEPSRIIHIVKTIMAEMDATGTNQIPFEDFEKSLEVFDMSEKLVVNIPDCIDK